MAVHIEPIDVEAILLREIGDSRLIRDDVAWTYAVGLLVPDTVDWPKVNRAIIDRWSENALKYIKTLAWKRHLSRPG